MKHSKPMRVLKRFGYYSVGDIIYPMGLVRDRLRVSGVCEDVVPEEVAVETATVSPAECTATRTAPPQGRRRRRRQVREALETQEAKGG